MAAYYAENYTDINITKPSVKVKKGEIAGRRRCLFDIRTITETLQVGDTIACCGSIPANSRVLDATVKVDKSLGATGIFSLGHGANEVDSADADAFIVAANAGGQAVLAKPTEASVGIHKRFESETAIILTVTEVLDGSVTDGIISVDVEYIND